MRFLLYPHWLALFLIALDAMSNTAKKLRTPKQVDPATQAAQAIVSLLEAQGTTDSTWISRSQLIEKIPDLTSETAAAALLKPPAKSRIVVASPSAADSPLLLKEHLELFATQGRFLQWLAEQGCSAETPVRLLTELTQSLDKRLKKLVDAYWQTNPDQLPEGLAPKQITVGRKKLFAIHDQRFPLPEEDLSQRLVAALQAERQAGGESYPTNWLKLKSLVDCSDQDALLERATAAPPFAGTVREVTVGDNRLLAFSADIPAVIQTDAFLKRLVQSTCSPESPETKLSVLAKRLSKDLQQSFFETWVQRVDQKLDLDFASLRSVSTKKKPEVQLRDNRFPPPEVALAENLVKILTSQKGVGGTAYPSSLRRLLELNGSPTTQAIRGKAIQSDFFRSQVVVSLADDANAAVVLSGDEELLARSPALLAAVLGSLLTPDNQAIGVDKIANYKSIHASLRPLFQSQIEQLIERRSMPEGFGAIKLAKKWSLFRLEDVICTPAATASAGTPSAASVVTPPKVADSGRFAEDFDTAFARLDGRLGLPHYASLVDLRPALSHYSREVFDCELLKLRQAGRYSLSLVEGRFGLSAEEQQACLVIDHVSHLLVQKK